MKYYSSKHKKSIVIGMLLGDGYIEKNGRFGIAHGLHQKDYLLYKAHLLGSIFKRKPQIREFNNNGYPGIKAYICSVKNFKPLRRRFYTPLKTVTRKMLNCLTPEGIALWYMDDGSLVFQKDSNGEIESRKAYINSQGFTFQEHELIVTYFYEVWNIKVKIHKDKNGFRLYFNSCEAKKLLAIIKPYIIPSMNYKQCMRYGIRKRKENLCGEACNKKDCKLCR